MKFKPSQHLKVREQVRLKAYPSSLPKLDFYFVAAISMNGMNSRSNSLEADVGYASAAREGGEGAERDHSSRRRHQTTLAVISLDTTPGNTDVEDGGGGDQVWTQPKCFNVERSTKAPSLQDDAQPTRILRSRYFIVQQRWRWYILLPFLPHLEANRPGNVLLSIP